MNDTRNTASNDRHDALAFKDEQNQWTCAPASIVNMWMAYPNTFFYFLKFPSLPRYFPVLKFVSCLTVKYESLHTQYILNRSS